MENTPLRFSLSHRMMRMKYGDSRKIDRDIAHQAWPPTGDHDRSIEGAFRAMALAADGNRPEESYTTQERILRDLDPSFTVEQEGQRGDWIVRRRLHYCPKCKGKGNYRKYEAGPESMAPDFRNAAIETTAVVAWRLVSCDHSPEDD